MFVGGVDAYSKAGLEGLWLPGGGLGRLGRFIGAGSLLDHPSDRVREPPPSAFHFKKGQRVALLGPYD
jgi:hypothetical protein